jgi:hypothetical protein
MGTRTTMAPGTLRGLVPGPVLPKSTDAQVFSINGIGFAYNLCTSDHLWMPNIG